LEKYFHPDSYGYRPKKSALDAVGMARQRCWRYDWALHLDIRSYFDSISHELLLKAVRKHTDCGWVLLYIERWLRAPVQLEDGTLEPREKGSPQGSVVSPLLSNLFLHYAFDRWVVKNHPDVPFERFADDGAPRRREGVFSALITSKQPCCTRDEGRPLNPDCRIWGQTNGCCFGRMAEVVSETGKGRARPCQVRVEKTSESKPPMNRRKRRNDVKTRWQSLVWDQLGGNLSTAQAASGGRGGVSSTQALVWNVGTCVSMPREQLKRTTRESLSTEAGYRGGAVRISDEGSVTEPERRGGIVQPDWKINWKREESFG